MNPQETFVRHFCIGYGADVVVVVARAGSAVLAVPCGRALVDELPAHQRFYLADDRALAHAECTRDGVRVRLAFAFLPCAGNQVCVEVELIGV